LNKLKTQAISLSGEPHDDWNSALQQAGFPPCHDRSCATPLIYLGYPLATSRAQLTFFLENLLNTIRHHCELHLQRGLLIRGRVTVLNSLILSKAWHILRIVGTPTSSVCHRFLMHHMFPCVSWSKLCQTRDHGGVGILDPVIQQNALQLRWLHQMLGGNGTYPVHIQCLIMHILATSKFSSDFRVLFLLFSARK
ncbi:hypothetical protein BJV82DRAFT_485147, partial [Fennellomyces sp. T-0311]